jgi:iron-sulfur cluster assembly accessory protein
MPDLTPDLTLSATAAARINAISDGGGLRVAVEGGGCSGFSYEIDIVPGPDAEDIVVERDGARLFVDPVSIAFLKGSEVDWVDELIGSSFKVKNPNAKSSCGCGVSFSV